MLLIYMRNFLIINITFNNWKISLLGCLFINLSPRIFAHSFYNSKDIILLCFFIISTYTLIKLLKNKTTKFAILHALSSAALINIRLVGLYIPIITLMCFFIYIVSWWDAYGILTPTLKKIVIRILRLCCTASNCVRNWSTFELVKSASLATFELDFIFLLQ